MNYGGEKRTEAQNAALHIFYRQLSEELNKNGADVKHVIAQMKQGVDVLCPSPASDDEVV